MPEQLAYVIITPYSLHKSRTGGILSRLLARTGLEHLARHRDELTKQASEFPEEARQQPAVVAALVTVARDTFKRMDEAWLQARQRKAGLEKQLADRQKLQQKILGVEKELKHAKMLAELLGRNRLQLYMVRTAERQVVDHANAVLDRLSGGQLFLRLAGEAGGDGVNPKALSVIMGHSTIAMTFDTYGHLMPGGLDEAAAAANAYLAQQPVLKLVA